MEDKRPDTSTVNSSDYRIRESYERHYVGEVEYIIEKKNFWGVWKHYDHCYYEDVSDAEEAYNYYKNEAKDIKKTTKVVKYLY